jgi:hypothetical protein
MLFGSAAPADYHLPSTVAEKTNLHLSNELLTLKRTLEEHQVQRLGKLPTIPFLAVFAPRHPAEHACEERKNEKKKWKASEWTTLIVYKWLLNQFIHSFILGMPMRTVMQGTTRMKIWY